MNAKKVLVIGASGLVGNAVLKEMRAKQATEVIAISRRRPLNTFGATFVSLDLLEEESCERGFKLVDGVTHVVYAGLFEKKDLTSGWLDKEQIETNRRMFQNFFEAFIKLNGDSLQHVTLLQGTKAYGGHVRPFVIPAKEGKTDAREIENFYWVQEDYIREQQTKLNFSFTILRPQIVVGKAIGSAMNLLPAIGVYASIQKEKGESLKYPGTSSAIFEVVDVDLLARSILWAGESPSARNETFNVANGDVMTMKDVWPVVAECFQMEVGEDRPLRLADTLPYKELEWQGIVKKYGLSAPSLEEFVGQSFQFADRYLNDLKYPLIVSTVKIKQAGFTEVMDTEEMFRKWFHNFQEDRLLPNFS